METQNTTTAQEPKPVRGQGVLEWYEALISAALVLVLVFSFFFRGIHLTDLYQSRRAFAAFLFQNRRRKSLKFLYLQATNFSAEQSFPYRKRRESD